MERRSCGGWTGSCPRGGTRWSWCARWLCASLCNRGTHTGTQQLLYIGTEAHSWHVVTPPACIAQPPSCPSPASPSYPQTHHPLSTAIPNEVNTSERWSDLRSVLESHPNVRLLLTGHFHKVCPLCPLLAQRLLWVGKWLGNAASADGSAKCLLLLGLRLEPSEVHSSAFVNHRRAWTGGPPTPSPPARCLPCATRLRITLCWICTQMAASGKWAMCAVPAAVGVSAGTFLWGPSRPHFQLASAVSRSHHLVPQSPRPLTPPPLQLERLGQEPGRRALQRLVDIFWRRRAAAGRDGGE